MILKGISAIEYIKKELDKVEYKDIEWMTFSGYFEYPKIEDSNWNKDYFAKVINNELQWFIIITYHRYDKSINLSLYISKNNKDNFFKIINFLKDFFENNFNFNIVYFKIARKNKKMLKIIKILYNRYDNLYFLNETINCSIKSILGNESSFLEFVYIIRDKEKYLNDFIIEIQKYFSKNI